MWSNWLYQPGDLKRFYYAWIHWVKQYMTVVMYSILELLYIISHGWLISLYGIVYMHLVRMILFLSPSPAIYIPNGISGIYGRFIRVIAWLLRLSFIYSSSLFMMYCWKITISSLISGLKKLGYCMNFSAFINEHFSTCSFIHGLCLYFAQCRLSNIDPRYC